MERLGSIGTPSILSVLVEPWDASSDALVRFPGDSFAVEVVLREAT